MSLENNELVNEANKCIRCGLCQMVCPIYAELGSESAVARGKVRLIKELAENKLEISPRFKKIMALCLNCKACVDNCPPMVQTDKLVLKAREEIGLKDGFPMPIQLALQNFLPNNKLQGIAAKMASFYKCSGLQNTLRKNNVIKAISPKLAQTESLMPGFANETFRARLDKIDLKKGGKIKVLYFISCMTNMVNTNLGLAVIKVLEEHDCEVIIPRDVKCCGMPHIAYGDVAKAKELARKNINIMLKEQVDFIITDCATCGGTLKDYGELVPEGREFAAKVYDISEFIVNKVGLKVGTKKVEMVATYHDSCHLNRGQKVKAEPREILKAIEGLMFKEMPEADRCCGSAGSFSITNYDVAVKILDRKINNVKKVEPNIVATGCPACKMQLEHGIERHKLDIKVLHPVEILAKTY